MIPAVVQGILALCHWPRKLQESLHGGLLALQTVGILDFSFHALRYLTAHWLRMTRTDCLTVKEILGHAERSMTARYAHAPTD